MADPLIQLRSLEKSYDIAAGKFFVLRRINFGYSSREFCDHHGAKRRGQVHAAGRLLECWMARGPANTISLTSPSTN